MITKLIAPFSLIACLSGFSAAQAAEKQYNVLFMIADDLTSTALNCYGNKVCHTPHIDKLAKQGTRFTHTYCQATFCGPSRASMMFSYYPHATKAWKQVNGRKAVGPDRNSWSQHFKNNGYQSVRISKIFHMDVPRDISNGSDGTDDEASWSERFNSQGPEHKAPTAKGDNENLEGFVGDKLMPIRGGNTFGYAKATGDHLVHSDGKTAEKAIALLNQYKENKKPFFMAVGFVRPHVPFVAPAKYFEPYPLEKIVLPPKIKGDFDDIPDGGGNNSRTTSKYKMTPLRQKKAIAGYYATVSFVDDMVGKIMATLEKNGQRDNTIVIFTSDHGYHLGEHDLWSKVSIHKESAQVPLIISVPGKKPAVCHSFTELIDLYPTTASLCKLKVPANIQGKDISPMLDNPNHSVREAALSGTIRATLLRSRKWAYMKYAKNSKKPDPKGFEELYDMVNDPDQFKNLAKDPKYAEALAEMQKKLAIKLAEVEDNDLKKK